MPVIRFPNFADRTADLRLDRIFLRVGNERKGAPEQVIQATFHPVIFNYQSTARDPAVLTILVTRQGSSVTVVDNARDTVGGESWGQRLFFNAAGERAPLAAERLSDVGERGQTMNGESAASLGEDAKLLLLVPSRCA